MKILNFFKSKYFLLTLIILIAFLVRLYKIDTPLADWHSWRQADTAAVARNFYKEGYNPFLPKYDDMSGVAENPIPNPERYRFVEFPIYNSLVYFTYLLNGGVDERYARLVSILFSLGSTIFIYLITRRYFGNITALLSSLLFAVLPFNIYFSRVILPEPTLVFFSLGMFYFTDRWIREGGRRTHFTNEWILYFVSVFFALCAFLTKPQAAFYLLPLLYVYFQKEGKLWPIPKRYFLWIIPALAPLVAWRVWINQHPEGIPSADWLLNGNGIRFKPAFWKWIIGDRFGREILSVTGTFLFFLGMIKRPDAKEGWVMHLFALSSLLFVIIFATGNVQHDYYQTFIVPALVIFTARGFVLLFQGIPGFVARIWTIPLAILFLGLMLYFGWNEVKGLYQINNPVIVEAGKRADQILPKDALVIAPYNGDTSFLYQTNRAGWAFVAFPVPELVGKYGVKYFISTNKDAKTNWVMRRYTTLEDNSNFVIVDLTREQPNFDYQNDIEPN